MSEEHPPQPPVAPTTTKEQDRTTLGQRRINLVWELTQAIIAFAITLTAAYCEINKIEAPTLRAAFLMVLTMYFVRTNHQKIGGVGGADSREQR